MSSLEFTEWIAYAKLEPFGERRADWRAAQIVAMLANVNRGKGQRAYEVKDFLLQFGRPEPQSWEHQLRIVEALNAAFGGEDLRPS